MISQLGRRGTSILDPIVIILKRLGFTPNLLSILGFCISLIAGLCFSRGHFIYGSLSLIVAGFFDILDGKLARIKKTTTFGAFLDSSLDRYSDAFVFCGIAYHYIGKSENVLTGLSLCSFIGAFLTSYTKARAEKWIEIECGILERPERIILLIIGGITRMDIVLWILAILGNITAIQRIFYAKRCFKKQQSS